MLLPTDESDGGHAERRGDQNIDSPRTQGQEPCLEPVDDAHGWRRYLRAPACASSVPAACVLLKQDLATSRSIARGTTAAWAEAKLDVISTTHHRKEKDMLIKGKQLLIAAAIVVALFAIAAPLGDSHHGIGKNHHAVAVLGNVVFGAFLIGAAVLIILIVVALIQYVMRSTRRRNPTSG